MDEPMGKTLTWEEREKVKEKLASLKKEYHQTFRRLQRSQKAERVKTHVKKTIEEQNRILSQPEAEMGLTDPERGVMSALTATASGSEGETQRKSSVTFNLEPEVFCIGEVTSTSHLPENKDDQQPFELSNKTPETTPRSRLKLRRVISTWKKTDMGSAPPSFEVSLPSTTLQKSSSDQEADLMALGNVSFQGSSTRATCDEIAVGETFPPGQRHDMNILTSDVPPAKEGVRRPPKNDTDGAELHPLSPLDLSTESLESTPSLYISPTPGSPVNRGESEVPAFPEGENLQGKGSYVELGSYFCISGKSVKGTAIGSPNSNVNVFNTQYKPTITEPRRTLISSPVAEQSPKHAGDETTALTVMPDCAFPSVTVDSPLNSCTLVEGLLFPVEYYVRTTRRMSSCQRKVDLDAVIQSHLGTNRKGSRKKVKQVIADAEKVDSVSLNQKRPLKCSKLLIPETFEDNVGTETTAGTCSKTPSQGTPTSSVSMTKINNFNRERKVKRRTSGRGRKKARFTRKSQLDGRYGPGENDNSDSHCHSSVSSSADSPSQKEHIPNKNTDLLHQSCTLLADRVETDREMVAVPPADGSGNTKERTKPVIKRNSPTNMEIPTDDMNDFELGFNVRRTPKQRARCTWIRTKAPGTPLGATDENSIAVEPSPRQSPLLSDLHRKRGKDQRGCSLNETTEVLDSRESVELPLKGRNSLFHTPEDLLNLKMPPVTLDVQDFHLPDEEYGLLKLEKLKSSCIPPLESFVCQFPDERFGINGGQDTDQACVTDIDTEMQSAGLLERDHSGTASEQQVFTSAAVIKERALREQEDQAYSVEGVLQDQTVLREPSDQYCTTKQDIQERTPSRQSGDFSSTSKHLVDKYKHSDVLTLETQFYEFGCPTKEPNAENECIDQTHQSDNLLTECSSELDSSHQLYTGAALIGYQSQNKETMFKQRRTNDIIHVDDLALSGDPMAELSTLELQGSVSHQPDGSESTASFLLMTPVGTDPPDTASHTGVPTSTPFFPTFGPTPAPCTSLISELPSSVPCKPESQTTRIFCSETTNVNFSKQDSDFTHCTTDVKGYLRNPITLQKRLCPTTELQSETWLLRSQTQYETSEPYTDMRPVGSDAGYCETNVLHSQSRAIMSKSEQCEMSLHHSENIPLTCEAWQTEADHAPSKKTLFLEQQNLCENSRTTLKIAQERHSEPNVIFPILNEAVGEGRLPESDLKTSCYGGAEQNEPVKESASCVWGAGRERTLKVDLQLLSQIQPPASDTCAVDLSTVWWDSVDCRALCMVTASKSSVSVWKPLNGCQWEVVYTWNSPEVPIVQLIPLPDQHNVLCVALGHLDIEEIWVLFCSSDVSGLSALKVKSGPILTVRGLSRRRVVSSSGIHPDQYVEVMFLSEMGRSQETLVLRSPEETVLSFAEVEGERNALVGTTAANNAVIWNASSGQLLKKIPIGHPQETSICLQAYSELGLLFMIVSHPHAHESESSQRHVLSLIATNPKQALSVHVMSYALPKGYTGRYLEGDLKDHMAVAVLTTGSIALWDLHLGHCTVLLPPSSLGKWSLVKWCMVESHLFAGQKDGSVYVYKYSETCEEKT
ncbi:partner and localizer of BRCA2 isoform X2 [Lissotriton helveticus]